MGRAPRAQAGTHLPAPIPPPIPVSLIGTGAAARPSPRHRQLAVEQRLFVHRVGAVPHGLGFAVGVATDPHSRWPGPSTMGALSSRSRAMRLNSPPHAALAVTEPADAAQQALEGHPFLHHLYPTA